jgi:hypothetical protein
VFSKPGLFACAECSVKVSLVSKRYGYWEAVVVPGHSFDSDDAIPVYSVPGK